MRLTHSSNYDEVLKLLQTTEQNALINAKEKDDILVQAVKVLVQNKQASFECLIFSK